MRSITIVASLIVVLLVACSACGARQLPDEVPTMSNPAIAHLNAITARSPGKACTAWKLNDKYIVTAGHCCEPDSKYILEGPFAIPGQLIEPVQYDDDTHDICIIKAEMLGEPLPLATRDPAIGERVWTAGYPQGMFLISDGHWSGRNRDNIGIASVAGWGGASGSPLMNAKGQVVGVLVSYLPPQSNLTGIAPLEWLKVAVSLSP